MASFKRFEDIEAWKLAREISKEIYKVSGIGIFARDFELKNQARASSGSMMDNIAEGFGRGGKNEFVQFLTIAKGSAEELKSQLYRSLDNEYISESIFENIYTKTDTYSKMTAGLISYLNQSSIKGEKFKNRVN
ncbi:MAG: four helix bundle protein [Bacteroidetes bacterium]|nr:four helix bundle protein [Bacteroidota bacterium]